MMITIISAAIAAVGAASLAYFVAKSNAKTEIVRLEAGNAALEKQMSDQKANQEMQLSEQKQAQERVLMELKQQYERQMDENRLRENEERARLKEEHQQAMTRLQEQQTEQMRHFQDRIQLETQEVLKKRQEELQKQNDVQMEAIMKPLKEQIASLNEQLTMTRESGAAKDAKFQEMLNGFIKQANEMGAATDKLANAMMSNGKVHGDWGEQVLESILESCGMQLGINYLVQASSADENGQQQRPDVYILCPKNRRIVIDSKVSLTAYANYLSAKDAEASKRYEAENYHSVKAQVDRLASKAYQKLEKNNYGIVLMFVPNEGAYILAMRHEASLAQYAYNKGVVILTPTNLMLTLQLIEGMWQKENEEQNIQNILETAGTLLEKFASFSDKMAAVRRSIEAADKAFGEASKYLTEGRGNVVRQLENLATYGVKYNKSKKLNSAFVTEGDEEETSQMS